MVIQTISFQLNSIISMLVLEANIDQISQHHHYLVADSQHCSVNRAHSPQVDPSVGLSVAVCILHTAHSVL